MKEIELSEDDIDIIDVGPLCHVRFCSMEGEEIEWTDEQAHKLKAQILEDRETAKRVKHWCDRIDYSIEDCSKMEQLYNLWLKTQLQNIMSGKKK